MGSACLHLLPPCSVDITLQKSAGDGVAFSLDEKPLSCVVSVQTVSNSVDSMRVLTEDTELSVQRLADVIFLP